MPNPTFRSHFKIPATAKENFIDIPLDGDIEYFICPFLIVNNVSTLTRKIYAQMSNYLTKLNEEFVKPNLRNEGLKFLSKLHEPNEYHIGYSETNKGKAISKDRAELIYDALRKNAFGRSKKTTVTNVAHNVLLLVNGIGQDIMSDTIANVCRDEFAKFTGKMCSKYGIAVEDCEIDFYDLSSQEWKTKRVMLPFYKGKRVILVGMDYTCGKRTYATFYNNFVCRNQVTADILNKKKPGIDDKRLFRDLKDGTKKAIIKEIIKMYKKPKAELVAFVKEYPKSLLEFQDYAKEHYPSLNIENLLSE